jgi:hypothetical protein
MKNKDCRHCVHISEDIAGGTNYLFCNHPDIDSSEHQPKLDPSVAEICDFYEQEGNPGLYFHDVPLMTND